MATTPSPGSIRGRVEALADRITQTVETVTRNSRIFIESGDVDDINPPEDIDQYHDHYRQIGIIRANLNKFVRDVVKPGVRIEADDDTTEAYFMGGDGAPDDTPEGGFLKNCAVIAGEKRQPFYPYLKVDILQKWTKGTTFNEYLKAEGQETDPEYQITGFKHVRPETVSARTYANTNILLDPDAHEQEDVTVDENEITKRNEAAAYVQFDDNSIVGRRTGGIDEDEVLLSQNDVLKRTLDPDIGGDEATEDGIFGVSILESVGDDAEEYKEIKRDRARAIKTKAYGVWSAQFNTEVTELPDEVILQDWDSDEQDEWVNDVDGLGPGDIIGHDGSIELDQWEPSVPELEGPLEHYVSDILAPLPAPKYATAFGESIANHVSDRQENSYEDTILEERRAAERDWTAAFREVAERHDRLDPSGLKVVIAPEEDESPIRSMDDDEVDRLKTYAEAVKGIEMVSTLSEEEKRELLLQLPGTPKLGSLEDADVDEEDPDIQEMAEQLTGENPAEANSIPSDDEEADN
jgi:hypothetical protein